MRYIKNFESLINNDGFKNKILLIDASGSFKYDLKNIIEKELYLSDKFTALFCSYEVIEDYYDIDLNKLKKIIDNDTYACGFDGMQKGIDYIINKKLEGAVLIFSDGFFEINISKLPNDISVLSTQTKPDIIGGECQIFIKDIDTTEYYAPRDCKSMEEYEYRKNAKKYNL